MVDVINVINGWKNFEQQLDEYLSVTLGEEPEFGKVDGDELASTKKKIYDWMESDKNDAYDSYAPNSHLITPTGQPTQKMKNEDEWDVADLLSVSVKIALLKIYRSNLI